MIPRGQTGGRQPLHSFRTRNFGGDVFTLRDTRNAPKLQKEADGVRGDEEGIPATINPAQGPIEMPQDSCQKGRRGKQGSPKAKRTYWERRKREKTKRRNPSAGPPQYRDAPNGAGEVWGSKTMKYYLLESSEKANRWPCPVTGEECRGRRPPESKKHGEEPYHSYVAWDRPPDFLAPGAQGHYLEYRIEQSSEQRGDGELVASRRSPV